MIVVPKNDPPGPAPSGRKPTKQLSVEVEVADFVRPVARHDRATLSDTIRKAFACWIRTERSSDFAVKEEP